MLIFGSGNVLGHEQTDIFDKCILKLWYQLRLSFALTYNENATQLYKKAIQQ